MFLKFFNCETIYLSHSFWSHCNIIRLHYPLIFTCFRCLFSTSRLQNMNITFYILLEPRASSFFYNIYSFNKKPFSWNRASCLSSLSEKTIASSNLQRRVQTRFRYTFLYSLSFCSGRGFENLRHDSPRYFCWLRHLLAIAQNERGMNLSVTQTRVS